MMAKKAGEPARLITCFFKISIDLFSVLTADKCACC